MSEPTPEAVELLARAVHVLAFPNHTDCEPKSADLKEARLYLEAAFSVGYVPLAAYLNGLTASERLELGNALCREAAEMDEDECIDDTDLCEHGLRFGCEDC